MSFIFNFNVLLHHQDMLLDNVIYVKISDSRLEKHTIELLIISKGVVVEQSTVIPGDLATQDFIGMSLVELAQWSSSSEDDDFESREIDVNHTNNINKRSYNVKETSL